MPPIYTARGETVRNTLLAFIIHYQDQYGFPPSIRDMVSAMGVGSTSVIKHHLKVLAQRGVITHAAGRARTLKVSESARQQMLTLEPTPQPTQRRRSYFEKDAPIAEVVVPLPYAVEMPKRKRRK